MKQCHKQVQVQVQVYEMENYRMALTYTIHRVKACPMKCAHNGFRLGYRIVFIWGTWDKGLRQVEVDQFDFGRVVEGTEDVFRLDVAVDKALLMDVL